MKKYLTINWSKAQLLMLPPILRKLAHITWLSSLLTPLKSLYENTLYKMQHNGQVIYLEKVLNEIFNEGVVYDPNYSITEKQARNLIYIDETLQPKLKYVYKHEEYYLHTPAEHFTNVSNTAGEIILDEEGFLDPIEIFTHHELVCESQTDENIYNTYLANTADYTTVAYANFRIMIPESLNIDTSYFDTNSDGVIDVLEKATLQQITNQIYFVAHPEIEKELAGAIEVRSPKFHQVVNFYKLAGKTYETYKYNNNSDTASAIDECNS